MRTLTVTRDDTGETRDIRIRPLKRKQIKALKEYGFSPLGFIPKGDTQQEILESTINGIEAGFSIALSESDLAFLDECSNSEANRAWKAVHAETYGDKDEEKNLSATTSGTSTESESTTVKNAGDSTSNHQSA